VDVAVVAAAGMAAVDTVAVVEADTKFSD
jgi:hypothetical protein